MLSGHCWEPILLRDKDYICQGSSPRRRVCRTITQGKLVTCRGQDWLRGACTPRGGSALSPGGVPAAQPRYTEPHPAGCWVGYDYLNLIGKQSAPRFLVA